MKTLKGKMFKPKKNFWVTDFNKPEKFNDIMLQKLRNVPFLILEQKITKNKHKIVAIGNTTEGEKKIKFVCKEEDLINKILIL